MAGLVRVGLQVSHFLDELLGILFAVGIEGGRHDIVRWLAVGGLRKFPHLRHTPVLEDFPALAVHNQNAVERGFQLGFQQRGLPAQLFFRLQTVIAQPLLFQRTGDGIAQSRQAVFEQIISRAAFHRLHVGIFTDGSGNENEGNVQAAHQHELRRPQTVELRQRIIRAHDGRQFFQLRQKIRFRFHTSPDGVETIAPELGHHQFRVVR